MNLEVIQILGLVLIGFGLGWYLHTWKMSKFSIDDFREWKKI